MFLLVLKNPNFFSQNSYSSTAVLFYESLFNNDENPEFHPLIEIFAIDFSVSF